MNKVISVYELLGLIKDGKPPKIVKWEDYIFSFYDGDYLCKNKNFIKNHETNYLLCYLFSLPGSALNIKVEILEEDKPTIEPITLNDWSEITYDKNWELLKNDFNKNMKTIFDRLNKIINYINEKEKENE